MDSAVKQFPAQQQEGANKGLVAKLIAVIQEIQPIPKRGQNTFSGYAYATAEDIIMAVRGPLSRHGLLVYSSLQERTSEAITTAQGKQAFRERITMRFTVTDGESELHFDVPGEGQDTGDKGTYMALTGSTKYALRSLLQLPIGDDPEADATDASRTRQKAQPPLVMPRPTHPTAQASKEPSPATEKQVNAIRAVAKALGMDEEALKSRFLVPKFGANEPFELSRPAASRSRKPRCHRRRRRGSGHGKRN